MNTRSPGGKLVAVDLEVVDERLADVSVSGDFFLEPDEALDDINAALTGLRSDAGVDAAGRRGDRRARRPVPLIGFTPEAVGHRRPPGARQGDRLARPRLRLSSRPVPLHPAMHVALDEVHRPRRSAAGRGRRRCASGSGTARSSSSAASSRSRTRSTRRAPPGTASTSCAASPAAARCSWSRATASPTRSYVPASLVEGLSFERVLLLPRRVGASRRWPTSASTAHYVPLNDIASRPGQDRRGRAEAVRLRRGAAPRDDGLRHRRRQDARGAADRAREDVATRAPSRPTSASTRCARRPGCPARRSSSPSPRRSRRRYATRASTYTDAELAEAARLVETKFARRSGPTACREQPAGGSGWGGHLGMASGGGVTRPGARPWRRRRTR